MNVKHFLLRAQLSSALVLLLAAARAFAAGPAPVHSDCGCPLSSCGWTLFVDENRGTPDFWWIESVTVDEIIVCEHGVQFLFPALQQGGMHRAALVFPNVSREVLADRLDLEPGGRMLESEFLRVRQRFEDLTGSLEKASGGKLREGSRMTFPEGNPPASPILSPARRLELLWRGVAMNLRGYLDVYFSVVV